MEETTARPSIDLVIPHYGGTDLTWRCLVHLWLFGVPGQRVIVVDDAAPDEMGKVGAWMERSKLGVYVRHEKNLGCTNAWNTALDLTRLDAAPYVAFVNNDVAVMPQTLPLLMQALRDGNRIVGCGDHTAARIDPENLLPESNAVESKLVTGMASSLFAVERSLVETLGFDGRLTQAFGDTDFFMRARLEHGVVPKIAENAVVFHGRSVAAKRNGLDVACQRFIDDQAAFRAKWGDTPVETWKPAWYDLERLKPVVAETWKDGES